MVQLTRRFLEDRADEVALTDEHGSWTWAEHDERANRLLHATRALGAGPADTVGMLAGNRHEFLELVSALGHGGYRFPPINWHFSTDEIAYVLGNSGTKVLFADTAFVEQAMAAAAQVPAVDHVVVFGGEVPDGALEYEALLADASPAEPDDQCLGAAMMYTSGTTGRPKGVESTALVPGSPMEVMEAAVAGYTALFDMDAANGRVLTNAPLYHGGPYLFGIVPFAAGAPMLLRSRFDAAQMLRDIDEHAITLAYAVPTHFNRLLRLPQEVRDGFDGSSLRAVYHTAAPVAPAVKKQMIEWWGPVIVEVYGATDAGIGTMATSEEWMTKPGTVGKPLPIYDILIVDEDGNRLGPGEVGTIYLKSLTGTDISYLGDEEKTKDAHLEPGTVTVGDVGYLDEDGFLFLSDRKIDMIISGGVNIYPAEIEAHLITHPAVADVGVFGIPDEEFGEQVKAAVLLAEGHEPSDQLEDELRAFCRDGLAGYKVPRSFDFPETFPRTETGKLQKRRLRDPYWEGSERAI